MTTYQEYAWDSAEDAARHAGESYERYLVPCIGLPCARPVVQAAALREGQHVLDVGCGTGVAARLAAALVEPTGSVTGVDPNPGMLDEARRAAPDIAWRVGAAESLPLPDQTFDATTSSLSFQFFADKATALHEIRRVLKPGGRVALGTPGPTPPLMAGIGEALREHVAPEASMFVEAVFSVHEPDEVATMIDGAGFEEVAVRTMSLGLRLPPPADFLWQYVRSTPLAGIATKLDDRARAALETDVVRRCRPYLDGDGLATDTGLLLATARTS